MNNEYITKQQAIDLAESLRPIAGNAVTDAFIKGIEGVEGCRLLKHKEPVDGKTIAIKLSPEIENTLRGWVRVKDMLPEDMQERVLVVTDCDTPVGNQKIDTDRCRNGCWVRYGGHVTNWMPLPKPPKEE